MILCKLFWNAQLLETGTPMTRPSCNHFRFLSHISLIQSCFYKASTLQSSLILLTWMSAPISCKLFWDAQLLDTGAPIARDWVVTTSGFLAILVLYNHAFIRHPHCNLDLFFLFECLHLHLVILFWNAQLLDTGTPIARDWGVSQPHQSHTIMLLWGIHIAI